MSVGKKSGNIVVWILIVMLIVGLGGFGVSNFGGSIDSIGTVGDEPISVDDYARELRRELEAQEAATGQQMTVAEAQQRGLVAVARGRVIAATALDNEVKRLGVSVGDVSVAEEVRNVDAFKGLDGTFDREAYRFALERGGFTEAEFEEGIREEIARSLLQGGIVAGVRAPDAFADTLFTYIAERRSFTYVEITPEVLGDIAAQPSDEALNAYYQENPGQFTIPEAKQITYAWLTPDMILDSIDVDEAALRELYNERIAEYVVPERRLVERLVFGTQDEAVVASARMISGEVDFDALVAERDLTLQDVDMGDVTKADLGPAGEAVFAMTEPGVTPPVTSDLGPAIFRMNAILQAQETPFEEARPALADELSRDRARRLILDGITDIDDRLAAGATLEELANETDMELGTLAYYAGQTEGIAAYDAFRAAAVPLAAGDFPEVLELEDGGIFALRLEEITPPSLQPLDAVRDQVAEAWQARELRKAQGDKAEAMKALLQAGQSFDKLGPEVQTAEGLTRGGIAPAALSDKVFGLSKGNFAIVDDGEVVVLVRLDEVLGPDAEDPTTEFMRATLNNQAAQGIANDLFGYFAESLLNTAGLTLDQAAINAVHAQFP